VLSFDISSSTGGASEAAARRFFLEFGFVVFRHVYTPDECAQTIDSMWSIVEASSPGFSRSEPSSWAAYQSAGKYGLGTRGPTFSSRTMVRNRQNENLAKALALVLDTDK